MQELVTEEDIDNYSAPLRGAGAAAGLLFFVIAIFISGKLEDSPSTSAMGTPLR
jgi:hypothetical protein